MKKYFKYFVVILILPIILLFSGCDANKPVSIKNIKHTGGDGLVSEYTITYTNGKTDKFTIVNGEDGANLYNNITIRDLYDEVKVNKPEGYSLVQFIDEYLDIQIDLNAIASSKALRSAVSIFVEHPTQIVDYNNLTGFIENEYGIMRPHYAAKQSITWNAGAGVIYDIDVSSGDAYIITNYHVCYNNTSKANGGIATRFTLYTYGAETIDIMDLAYLKDYNEDCATYKDMYKYDINGVPIIDYGYGAIDAEYVGGSEQYDIAVLKVTGSEVLKNSDFVGVEIYDSEEVSAGSTAIAVGNPDASGISVTNGVISVDSEYIAIKISDSAVVLREFRIDTPINGGNSGGGLFDGYGRLIGIVNAKTPDQTIENMSYAIPSNIATRIAQSIIDNCDGTTRKTNRVVFGVLMEAVSSKGFYDTNTGLMRIKETVALSSVERDYLADEMGLKPGDIINSVKIVRGTETIYDKPIIRTFQLTDAMLLVREGDSVIFNYTRGESTTNLATPILTSEHFITVQ